MSNQLGSSLQTSVLTVQGGAPPSGTRATTGIIVIAVICCVLGTSLVWVLIIYHTRRRAARHWEMEGKRMQSTLTGLPLLGGDGDAGKEEPAEEENVSEKDSGTGDSKRSYEHDMEPSIVDHVIHNFLSARGEAGEWAAIPQVDRTTTSMSDLDTGISSMGDSSVQQQPALHRKGCPRLKSIPPPPSTTCRTEPSCEGGGHHLGGGQPTLRPAARLWRDRGKRSTKRLHGVSPREHHLRLGRLLRQVPATNQRSVPAVR